MDKYEPRGSSDLVKAKSFSEVFLFIKTSKNPYKIRLFLRCERGWDRTIDLCLIRTAFYH